MPLFACIINDSSTLIWGLTARQRQERVLKAAGVSNLVDDIAALPPKGSVLLLRGDYLFDDRVIQYMVQTQNILLQITQDSAAAAVQILRRVVAVGDCKAGLRRLHRRSR